jgi:L-amino acid N-acyltransferase YncA
MTEFEIRRADAGDWGGIWPIFREVVVRGDTYAYPVDTNEAEARAIWLERPTATYVAARDREVVGTYYLKPNQPGQGSHVCNAGYMVGSAARGLGVGRSMCAHSLVEAKRLGFTAMQYNLVVATNERAVALWKAHGFEVVGILPKAFKHPEQGFVDALAMYRLLDD